MHDMTARAHAPAEPSGKKRLPRFAWILYAVTAACAVLMLLFWLFPAFSDFFTRHIGSVLRAVLAHLTSWLPFSLAEYFILLSPAILVGTVLFMVRRYADSWRDVGICLLTLLSILGLFFSLFTVGFASAYHGSTLDQKLQMERREVSAEELKQTALILSEQLNAEAEQVSFESGGFSVMPYSLNEMNTVLNAAYDKAYGKYAFLQPLHSRTKPVMLSELMSYTHITGVYAFFTGEANLNVAFPDYTLPYTAAHELAHQRGIAREDEANFMAFLVCMEADDPYVRYSAYLSLYEYVASALYSANPQYYTEVNATLPLAVRFELKAFSDFFEKYNKSVAADVSETVNNTFLVMQGTEGTKSYGMVVDLAVAFYRPSMT